MTKRRVLVLCTGNSARSQMAEGLLRHDFGDRIEVASAGTHPSVVRPEAIAVMREIGIDISAHRSKHVDQFRTQPFDDVVTVCSAADARCPVFPGPARRHHRDFEDPVAVTGKERRLEAFRRVRDDLRLWLADVMSTEHRDSETPREEDQ
jgi:arsenate reductase